MPCAHRADNNHVNGDRILHKHDGLHNVRPKAYRREFLKGLRHIE